MEWYQLALLALIQGITEFLPISSSAHLILMPYVFGWADQGLAFDLAVHLGTLLAVVAYFRRELWAMARAWLASLAGRGLDTDARLAWGIIIATLPAVLLGLAMGQAGQADLRTPWIIAVTSIAFGVLLGWVDWQAREHRSEQVLGVSGYLAIGLAQAVALIPGSSRSGMTIMAGRALGLTRTAAARVSFLLAIPITLAAVVYESVLLAANPQSEPWLDLFVAAAMALVSAFVTIHFFLRLMQRHGLMPFVVYRVVLGVVLLAVFGFEP